MIRRLLTLFLTILAIAASSDASSQVVNAGRKFAFGIPEGPDRQVDSNLLRSRIFLTVMGSADGCAAIKGPNGFTTSLDYRANNEREIELPIDYMQLWDEGFNKKGFVVETTQPAHLELHVVIPGASESTQIFPMEILDGDYLLSGWKLWNDPAFRENNRAQFLITAFEDNTQVAITVPNGLLPNIAPGSTVNITLNAGECYIGKMDTTLNGDQATSQVLIKASKAVNVMQANTCGYVPYGVQACNMMLDNVLPRKYFDTKFHLQPISREAKTDFILLTSETDNFGALVSDGTFYQTNDGRLFFPIDEPVTIETDAPVMCQIMTPGSSQAQLQLSDPTWVTIPPADLWTDTLIWYAPPSVGGVEQTFAHYITVIGPQTAFDEIMVDTRNLRDFGTMNAIPGTPLFATLVGVPQGEHKLSAPVPVLGIVSGIAQNDAYSFLPGGKLPGRYHPMPSAQPALEASQAEYCREMTVKLRDQLSLTAKDQVVQMDAIIHYDASVFRLINATPGSFFAGITGVSVDATTPGEIKLSYSAGTYINGSGELVDALFVIDGDVPTSAFTGTITLTTDEVCDNTRTFDVSLPVTINKVTERGSASIALSFMTAREGDIGSTTISVSDLPADASVREFDISLVWDHDFITYESHDAAGMIADGWTVTRFDESPTRMRLHFEAPAGEYLTNGELTRLNFRAYVTDDHSTQILAIANLPSERKCPLELSVSQSSSVFHLDLICGDRYLIDAMAGTLPKSSISPNPASDLIDVQLDPPAEGTATLYDQLGREVMSWPLSGAKETRLDIPVGAASGSHILSIRTPTGSRNLPLIIQK